MQTNFEQSNKQGKKTRTFLEINFLRWSSIVFREFEVNSIHFPGQKHRWKLSRLLQSGVQPANEKLFKVCSLSFDSNLIVSFFSSRNYHGHSTCWLSSHAIESSRIVLVSKLHYDHGNKALLISSVSWMLIYSSLFERFDSFILLSDALIGLPAVYSSGIDFEVENERCKFLVIELSPHVNRKWTNLFFPTFFFLSYSKIGKWKRTSRRFLCTNSSSFGNYGWTSEVHTSKK